MLYETLLRFLGAGIAGILQFQPFVINYNTAPPELRSSSVLAAPVTGEARRLVENGWTFRIEYTWSIIVNDARAYRRSEQHILKMREGRWVIDTGNVKSVFDSTQVLMGGSSGTFGGLTFDEGDRLTVFVKASLPSDSLFTASTGMNTAVLWNCFIPNRKETFLFTGGRFVRK